jgi:RHS repeat-associated protein
VETAVGVTRTYDYVYDADGQLTQVSRDGTAFERYTYDVNGNRISRQVGAGGAESASYDLQDRLTQQAGVNYQFDADGFLIRRGGDTFQYSTRGELVQATVGGQTIAYSYDGLGRRVSRIDSSGTYEYLYGNPAAPFQITQVRDPAGILTTFYYLGGRLFALERSGARYYVATDQVGTPRVVTDAAGNAIKVLDFDSYGNLISDSNPGFVLAIGFAGGLSDAATQLVHFGFRDYDPDAGRWTTRDPILFAGSQPNLYVYVANDPLRWADRTGLLSDATEDRLTFFPDSGYDPEVDPVADAFLGLMLGQSAVSFLSVLSEQPPTASGGGAAELALADTIPADTVPATGGGSCPGVGLGFGNPWFWYTSWVNALAAGNVGQVLLDINYILANGGSRLLATINAFAQDAADANGIVIESLTRNPIR